MAIAPSEILDFVQVNGFNWEKAAQDYTCQPFVAENLFYRALFLSERPTQNIKKKKKIAKKAQKRQKQDQQLRQQYQCLICLDFFPDMWLLTKHQNSTHANRDYKPPCSFCKKKVPKKNFKRHQLRCAARTK